MLCKKRIEKDRDLGRERERERERKLQTIKMSKENCNRKTNNEMEDKK